MEHGKLRFKSISTLKNNWKITISKMKRTGYKDGSIQEVKITEKCGMIRACKNANVPKTTRFDIISYLGGAIWWHSRTKSLVSNVIFKSNKKYRYRP